jgi:hypothetical protein
MIQQETSWVCQFKTLLKGIPSKKYKLIRIKLSSVPINPIYMMEARKAQVSSEPNALKRLR